MPSLDLDLSNSPYFIDHDANNDYYQLLFRPSVSVQVRELNELQVLLQQQIERFGDNIFKRGTIVSGCNFMFYKNVPYAKIRDAELDGTATVPELYKGLFAKNAANLQAFIIDYKDGYESSDPDLKTIYVSYTNAGNNFETAAFSADDTLTIFAANQAIFRVDITNGGLGFSNSDVVVFTPAIAVNVSSGSWSAGDYLTQPSTGANVEVIDVDTTSLASANQVLLYLKPLDTDMANASANALAWTLDLYEDVVDAANTVTGQIVKIYGQSAAGRITTNGVGKITTFTVTDRGNGYEYIPTVRVRSANNSSGLSSLDLDAKNYLGQVKISTVANSVGNGYSFGVTEGIIYQKGYFLRVSPQSIIVEKYSNSPNNVVAGFKTVETVVDSDQEPDLLDNALGTKNYAAPGANRLRLTPVLHVTTPEDGEEDTEFFDLVRWNDGNPYKQNQVTAYSRIGDEMARRTYDESGDYVIDRFEVATTEPANTAKVGSYYTLAVDPGTAYISGYRVATTRSYKIDILKAIDTEQTNNIISFNYGNYVRVKQLGGLFQYSTGDTVKLYDSAKNFLSNTSGITSTITANGTQIGTARIRSLTLESGTPGEGNAVYRAYLFDVTMNAGKNFSSTKGLFYDGTNKGIADVVLETDPSTSANIAVLKDTKNSALIFSAGVESLKNSTNTNYTYRTIDQTTAFSNNGTLTKSIAAVVDEFYPYTNALSSSQLKELLVVPLGNTLYQYTSLTGTVAVNTTSSNVVGSGTSFFDDFEAGDYIYVDDADAGTDIRRVISVTNATHLTVDAVFSFANTCNFKRCFPKNVPIPFGTRTGLSANVDANGNILTLSLAHSNGLALTLAGSVTVNTALGVNIERRDVVSEAKTATRNKFIKIALSNNAGGTSGPWCIGVPDVMRLRNVYMSTSSTVNTNSSKVTNDFYIDHNQNGNYLNLGWLYKEPRSGLSLTSSNWLLVEFDYFVRGDDGYFDTVSYLGTANTAQIDAIDSANLASLTTAACSWEVPEVYTPQNGYFDLINCLDFRPTVANTVAPAANAASAPVNPSSTVSFGNTADPANDKKFPLPDSSCRSIITGYMGRVDNVFIGGDKGNIFILKGSPASTPSLRHEPNKPQGALKLNSVAIPPYPNLSENPSAITQNILDTRIVNEKRIAYRQGKHTIRITDNSLERVQNQPKGYSMEDIGNLERRIKDLEYYTSLSLLESSLTNKSIPSSIDRTINRFKYGFFVDDFSTFDHSDVNDPQYAASIEVDDPSTYTVADTFSTRVTPIAPKLGDATIVNRGTNLLVPPVKMWRLNHVTENIEYINELLVSQNNATNTAPPDNCYPIVISTINNNAIVNGQYYSYQYMGYGETERFDGITFGGISGPVTLYFDGYSTGIHIEVYQRNTLVASTANSANQVSVLNANNKLYLTSNTQTTGFINRNGLTNVDASFARLASNTDFVKNVGKITWNYAATAGREHTVFVTKIGSQQKFFLEFPAQYANTTASTEVDPCVPPDNPPREYIGKLGAGEWNITSVGAEIGLKALYNNWLGNGQYGNAAFRGSSGGEFVLATNIWAKGLKPLTKHRLYVNGVEIPSSLYPGTSNITDRNGNVTLRVLQLLEYVQHASRDRAITIRGITTRGHGHRLIELVGPGSYAVGLIELGWAPAWYRGANR